MILLSNEKYVQYNIYMYMVKISYLSRFLNNIVQIVEIQQKSVNCMALLISLIL